MLGEDALRRWWKGGEMITDRTPIDGGLGKLSNSVAATGEEADALHARIEEIDEALALLVGRVSEIEEALPNATAIGEQLEQLAQAIRVAQGQIQWLAQQRGVAEMQLAFQLRSTALDLAIKAVPGAGAETLLPVADALVEWLKAGGHEKQ